MRKAFLGILLASFVANASGTQHEVSSLAIGIYDPNETALLAPAFINSVNRYLRRYGPQLLERSDKHVKMRVDYDYLYDVELHVNPENYEIRVTLAQEVSREEKAQKQAAKLSSGVFRSMESHLVRGTKVRDGTDNDGIR